ncbi:pyruvate dehydrogenase [acetyl-transferring]-phosphatase 1, mitochondrial [Lepeophtheirus salmonis]|uniref:pyruvate dehydrogenase [acetyl-transferring]-phosphatase 1, mitochondrial n=1 Tax=Lepeophtheirus salmonis TaxID=72036 RepID=UPI001AEA3CE5|nr:pyruvate dehydrogenase [acetyl-transferring]-phosphatase 1, mitochondrial-like [Lepeophtheirus salmonis]XP_040581537.1 pyruvate dehydrogenase [acetyl-transferring]-phosphatase 1, mitochondrial-like [Lepeophtheirus salmonis]
MGATRLLLTSGVSVFRSYSSHLPRFTPQEVTRILRSNEFTSGEFSPGTGPVKSFDINSFKSNNPIEDSHAEGLLKVGSKGFLFGVIDGHGGPACGQVVAKRILHYVASGLLSIEDLTLHLQALESQDIESEHYNLISTFNDPYTLVKDLQILYSQSYLEHIREIHSCIVTRMDHDEGMSLAESFIKSFESLDGAMSKEAENRDMKTLSVAMSGAVAVMAHIDGPHLHVASTGDCSAVLGTLSETDTWIGKKMTVEHNADNATEVKRIISEHPESEKRTILNKDRLLGVLAPLRAFGDFKLKWSEDKIIQLMGDAQGDHAVLPNYKTPPYLSVTPDVISHKLTARDKFLVIASDGLWDTMTPMQVIRLIGEHMSGKITLTPLELSKESMKLSDVNALLRVRQAAVKLKPADSNSATHIIRYALGGTAYGVDHDRLSQMLSIPQDMVRMFRDDITVQVIFFDSEYLRHC